MANPFPIVVTNSAGNALTITGSTQGIFSTAAPFPVVLCDSFGNFLTLGNGTSSTPINAMGNTTGAGVAMDLSKGAIITMTLTGNVTSSSFTNAPSAAGQEITFIITQDATGGRTFAWPTAVVPVGISPFPSQSPSAVSIIKGVVDSAGNVNFITNGPVVVYRNTVASVTTSNTSNETIFIPAVVGRYRLTAILTCVTTGTTATMTLQALNSSAGISGTITPSVACTSTQLTAASFTGGYVKTASTTSFGWLTTLTNAIGTAVYQVDYIAEYLGN